MCERGCPLHSLILEKTGFHELICGLFPGHLSLVDWQGEECADFTPFLYVFALPALEELTIRGCGITKEDIDFVGLRRYVRVPTPLRRLQLLAGDISLEGLRELLLLPRHLTLLSIETRSDTQFPDPCDVSFWKNGDWNDYVQVISETQPGLERLALDTDFHYYADIKKPLNVSGLRALKSLGCTDALLFSSDMCQFLSQISNIFPPSLRELELNSSCGKCGRITEMLCAKLEQGSALTMPLEKIVLQERVGMSEREREKAAQEELQSLCRFLGMRLEMCSTFFSYTDLASSEPRLRFHEIL